MCVCVYMISLYESEATISVYAASLADSKRTFVSGHYHSGDSQVRTGEQVWDLTFVLSVHNTPKKVIGCSFCKSS